jgi:acetyl esterase/lipase
LNQRFKFLEKLSMRQRLIIAKEKLMITEQTTATFCKQTYIYKTVGDCKIQADVYQIVGDEARPAIFWIHGGALIVGSRGQLLPDQAERYLRAGYTVVAIDYRLAPETKLPAIIEDIQSAYRWLREEGPTLFQIDPDRIAVIGHSAGGYLTLMAGFCLSPRPKALVSFYGYGDIAGDWYSRPDPFYSQQPAVSHAEAYGVVGSAVLAESPPGERGRFYLYCRQQGLWLKLVTGYDPDTEPNAFNPLCPVRNVTKEYPPTLLLHGAQDTDVPVEQSMLMAEALEHQHIAYQLLILPNHGHGFNSSNEGLHDPAIAEIFEQVLGFLRKQLGDGGANRVL